MIRTKFPATHLEVTTTVTEKDLKIHADFMLCSIKSKSGLTTTITQAVRILRATVARTLPVSSRNVEVAGTASARLSVAQRGITHTAKVRNNRPGDKTRRGSDSQTRLVITTQS